MLSEREFFKYLFVYFRNRREAYSKMSSIENIYAGEIEVKALMQRENEKDEIPVFN